MVIVGKRFWELSAIYRISFIQLLLLYLTEVQSAFPVTVIPIEQFIKNSLTYSIASSICLDKTLISFNEIEEKKELYQ